MDSSNVSTLSDCNTCRLHCLEQCKKLLSLDDITFEQASTLFRETKSVYCVQSGSLGTRGEERERLLTACVLYAVKRLDSRTLESGLSSHTHCSFTLSQLLEVTGLSIVEFLKEFPQFLCKSGQFLRSRYGSDWEKHVQIKEVQATLVHLVVLFNCYKRSFQDYFKLEDDTENKTDSVTNEGGSQNGDVVHSKHMKFGWMLFLAMRIHILGKLTDLVSCTNALLAVLAIMIAHMPPSFRKFSFEDESRFVKGSSARVDITLSLCQQYHASEDDVSVMVKRACCLIGVIFKNTGVIRRYIDAEHLSAFSSEGLWYFEGLLEDHMLLSNISTLEENYEKAYATGGELDERFLISESGNVYGSVLGDTLIKENRKVLSPGGTRDLTSEPHCNFLAKSGPSGVKTKLLPPATPVSTTMTSAKWLRNVIFPLPSEPPEELSAYFKACDYDVTGSIKHRAKVLLEGVFPRDKHHNSKMFTLTTLDNGQWAELRMLEALKLYYRVLNTMCKAESQHLHNCKLTALLTNERFHRCLLACSAEVVLSAHKTVNMTFPAVLGPTGITAFDLSKVIESFVRHEDTLPREIKRHLNGVEEKVLKSMGWEKGSALYNSLVVARPQLAHEIQSRGLLADPMPSLDLLNGGSIREMTHRKPDSSNFLSPSKERIGRQHLQPLQSAFESPHKPSAVGGETCADAVIRVFFQKVLMLAACEIQWLCNSLQKSQSIKDEAFCVFQYALQNATHIFFRRHIDQIILCSIYGVCKARHVDLTFTEIIERYRKQPQSQAHVFRHVLIREGRTPESDTTGVIIEFYNEVFVYAVRTFLLAKTSNTTSATLTSSTISDEKSKGPAPGMSSFPAVPDMSPKKVSTNQNVYVSPLRSTKADVPHSRTLYAVVGESPSKDLSAINDCINRRHEKLCIEPEQHPLQFDPHSESYPEDEQLSKRRKLDL